ncbi:MAG: hypothetical protein M3O35_02530 [Acidobacteriota bacterium]|nr:hypothetical protein [Acidobacteriota bacterium]
MLGNTAILFLGGNRVVDPVVSGDGQSIVYRTTVGNAQQLFFVHADGSGLRQLTTEAAGIATDTLSGDGKVAYAVTASGAIVRIDTQTGSIKQLVGPAPRIRSFTGGHAPGSVILVDGSGLSGTGVTIAGLPAPVVFASPERIDFQIPWETPVETQPVAPVPTATALALPGGDPYFDAAFPFPVYALDPRAVQLGPSDPRTNYIPVAVHQDGLRVVTLALPARAGEIVTIYATGLGPVSPPVVDGAAASASPLSLLTTPLKFSFLPGSGVTGNFPGFPLPAQVQFAGLAPGFVGLYQINVVVPNVAIPSVALAATTEGRGLLFLGDIALAQP